VEELALFRQKSKEVELLFKRAEEVWGKLLDYHEMNLLFGFYDWLRLPVDVLEFLLVYCAEIGHRGRSLRYIEACAINWYENDINTVEKARDYVQNFDANYRVVLRAIGQAAVNVTPTHRKYIDKWRDEMGMPVPLILEACERAVEKKGNPDLRYVDGIIKKWHTAGITTLEGVNAADEAFAKAKEIPIGKIPVKAARAKNSRFANFTQRKNDYTHLEQLQRDYVLRELNG
jgi:DnaD/phage-associated family protein